MMYISALSSANILRHLKLSKHTCKELKSTNCGGLRVFTVMVYFSYLLCLYIMNNANEHHILAITRSFARCKNLQQIQSTYSINFICALVLIPKCYLNL